MKQYKVLFCDLDGTLIRTMSGDTFPKGIWDMKFRFDVLDAIKKLSPEYVLIASNQGGIELGYVNEYDFIAKSEYIGMSMREYLGNEHVYSSYCPSNDKGCDLRKPNPGLLSSLAEKYVGDDFDYIKGHALMIGDASGLPGQFSDSDKQAALNFGIDYMDVDEFVRLMEHQD